MQCSNCGYDNPRENHYCGMCGTPFPYRALTVPQAQSTLAFTKTPLRVAAPPLAPEVREPVEPAATVAEESAPAANTEVLEPVEPAVQASLIEELEAVAQVAEPTETPAEALSEVAEVAAPEPEPVAEAIAEAPLPLEAASEEPVAVEPEVDEHPQPVTTEPEPAVAETAPGSVVERPATEVDRPAARVVVVPTPPYRQWPEPSEPPPTKPIVRHPSLGTQTFTPPPASAGMPTFQEVAEAAGAPPISPFEPPAERHTDEDRELQEYVASFRYTPPVETADELTMRSEAPVIDDEAPAQFHHASFDDDVPPPPEAGPHPTGEEYYEEGHAVHRPHYLEVSELKPREEGGAYPAIFAAADILPVKSRGWLWTTIAALVVLFGGLGFWEGRAQSTQAFRGPVEIALDMYDRLRQQLAQPKKSTAPAIENAADNGKLSETKPQPAASTSPAQPAPTKPESEAKPTINAATGVSTAKSEPPKPVQPPPTPKPTAKPQPGQQELDKAVNASDPTAAAAWLWKATSRGNPDAPVRLADMYIKGDGVPRSCEQAMVLLRSAATKENAPARNRLAALYANGTCVTRDRVKAYQLMSSALAVDPNSAWAKENQEVLWNQMTPQERAEAQKYR